MKNYESIVEKYVDDAINGNIIVAEDVIRACKRYRSDRERSDLDFRPRAPNMVISIIESMMVHRQGETLTGRSLVGKPMVLEPWEYFIIYNICGFYFAGTDERRYKEAFIFVPRKNGKALSLDTDIPTPNGWRKMSDIKVGDFVFGVSGKPVKVIAESEIFHKQMYRVELEGGDVIESSSDHVWTVQTKDSRRTSRRPFKQQAKAKLNLRDTDGWFDITTKEMASDYCYERADGKGIEYKYRVPMNEPVEYPEKDLIIDPYTFGVWLGDGASAGPKITCSEDDKDEMMKNISDRGHIVRWFDRNGRAGEFSIDCGRDICDEDKLNNKLKALGVINNKHIPDIYMHSSVQQRFELLRGLMDTDGTCSKAGQCEFVQKSERIAYQVQELLFSLGIKSVVRKKKTKCGSYNGEAYRVHFFTDKEHYCFNLERKKARLKDSLSPRMKAKSIRRITPIPIKPSKCIAVDDERHLYLAGRQYTATHNTALVAGLAFSLSILERKSGSVLYIVAASAKQAAESFEDICYSLRAKGFIDDFRVRNNNAEHSIYAEFFDDLGRPDGSIKIEALASNPDAHDSFNCNIAIADRQTCPFLQATA